MNEIRKWCLFATVLGFLAFSSCSSDDDEDPCLLVGTDCFCDANPGNSSCYEVCTVTNPSTLFVDSGTEGKLELSPGSRLGEFTGRFFVLGGSLGDFTFTDDAGATWGIPNDSTDTGILALSVSGSDCGLGIDPINVANTESMELVDITVNINELTYSLTYDERVACLDLNFEANDFYLKGPLSVPHPTIADSIIVPNAGNGTMSGLPLVPNPDRGEGWLTARVEFFPGTWVAFAQFKVVFNPKGDYGNSALPGFVEEDGTTYGGDGIALDYGPNPTVDGSALETSGILVYKAFELTLQDDGSIQECGLPCSTAPLNEEETAEAGCPIYNTGSVRTPMPGQGTEGFVQSPYTVHFNYMTQEYEVVFD